MVKGATAVGKIAVAADTTAATVAAMATVIVAANPHARTNCRRVHSALPAQR
jgi:hypothetical protein